MNSGSGLPICPSEVAISEPITIKVNVKNVGEVEGTYVVTLKVDGKAETTKEASSQEERLLP